MIVGESEWIDETALGGTIIVKDVDPYEYEKLGDDYASTPWIPPVIEKVIKMFLYLYIYCKYPLEFFF